MERKMREDLPNVVSKLIEKMIDEDSLYPEGTAANAVEELLERAIKMGRENHFKEALKFWKRQVEPLDEVLWQWFGHVFLPKPTPKAASKSNKKQERRKTKKQSTSTKNEKPRKRGGTKNEGGSKRKHKSGRKGSD